MDGGGQGYNIYTETAARSTRPTMAHLSLGVRAQDLMRPGFVHPLPLQLLWRTLGLKGGQKHASVQASHRLFTGECYPARSCARNSGSATVTEFSRVVGYQVTKNLGQLSVLREPYVHTQPMTAQIRLGHTHHMGTIIEGHRT